MSKSADTAAKRSDGFESPPVGLANKLVFNYLGWLVAAIGLTVLLAACATPSAEPVDAFPISMYTGASVVGGEEISFSDLQGRPIVLNFWAGQCGPCRAEMPEFQRFYQEYKEDVLLIGVDVGPFFKLGNRDDALQLLDEFGITYPTGFTTNGGVIRDYGILQMPTTVFITPDGEQFRKWVGALPYKNLVEITSEMLAESQG